MSEQSFSKDLANFHHLGDSLETRPELLTDFITANDLFFVCKATASPQIDPQNFTLKIHGDCVRKPLALSFEALLKLPSYTVIAYLECAGNQRELFERVMDQPVIPADDGFGMTKWLSGGVGNAVWTGVSLRTLLELAEIKDDAITVNGKGLDKDAAEGGISRPMAIEKALDPNTLVAYHMNGEPLPIDNGYPLRLLVPGWIGTNSVKWLGEITVSTQPIEVERNTKHYVFIGPEWEPKGKQLGELITTQNIKSSLALAWKAELPACPQIIRGNARSPLAPIAGVDWSADQGQTWHPARLIPPNLTYSWCRFEFDWDPAEPGGHLLMTRATDTAGNIQPLEQPFNAEGYLFNRVYPHPVIVAAAD